MTVKACYNEDMDNLDLLKKAGLTEPQAKVYEYLLTSGVTSPKEVAEHTGESRENCYAILKKLAELGLVEQTDDKKATYRVLNPSNLEVLVEKRRKVVAKNEKIVKDNISSLLDIFYANNELPGSRTLEGIDGIKEVYKDILRVKEDVYFIRTKADELLGSDEEMDSFLKQYRDQLPLLGIHTFALTPVTRNAVRYAKTGRDEAISFHRTWMDESDYTAPVTIMVYGDKVAMISFGGTQMATVVTSPTIAEAMRQIMKIMMQYYKKNFKQDY